VASASAFVRCVPAAMVLAVLGPASPALGAPGGSQRAAIFGPEVEATGNTCAGGASPTLTTFGSVVLNTPGKETTVTGKVTLKHATPSATFQVTLAEKEPGGLECRSFLVGTITTNRKGSAKLQFTAKRASPPLPTRFWVSVLEESPFAELLASSAVELD
jgi:hypothetical protein